MAAVRPPAGWYTDPFDASRQRWWDGNSWTGFLFDPGFSSASSQPTAAAGQGAVATEREPAASGGVPRQEPAVVGVPAGNHVAPQRILLGLGAALLIAAAAAFVAFAWTIVGPSGRATLITLVAAAFLIAAARVRLTAIRETFAIIGMGTVAVELVYGSASGLIPDGTFDPSEPWLTLTFGLASVASAALALFARLVSARIVAGASYVLGIVAAIAFAQSAWLSALNPTAVFAGLLGIAAALTFAIPVPARWPSVRIVASLVLAGIAWIIVCLALLILYAEDDLDADWVAALALIAITSAALWIRLPASHGLRPALLVTGVGFASAAVGLGMGLGLQSTPVTSATGASTLGSLALLGGLQLRRPWAGLTALLALWATWAMSSGLSALPEDQEVWAIGAFLAAAAVLTLGFALFGREPRVVWAVGPLGVLAAWVLLDGAGVTLLEAYSLAFACGVVVTFGIAGRRGVLSWPIAIDALLIGAWLSTLPSAAAALMALEDQRITSDEWLSIAVGALGTVGAFVIAVLRRRLRWIAAGGSAVLLLKLWILAGDWLAGSPTVEYLAWTAYVCFALAALAIARRSRWLALLGWGAVVAASTSVVPAALWAWDGDTGDLAVIPWLSLSLTSIAVTALVALGFRARRVWLFWIAAALGWLVLIGLFTMRLWPDDDRTAFVVTGAILLAAGACTRLVVPTLHSMLWMGIPLLLVVVPFAVTPGCDPAAQPVGFTVVLLAVGAMAIAGGWQRIAGLLAPGAVGVAIIAANVLWDAALAVPAWVSLGIAGVLLLVVGVRLEATRAGAKRGSAWVKSLD